MACAIGLSRILREDRATKDGAERFAHALVFERIGRHRTAVGIANIPAFSSREAKKA